jgi:diamine N-acetyltransferase
MIALRPVAPEDVLTIRRWPPYPAEFRDLDYALRQEGWLDEYRNKGTADILVAECDGEIAGFSIISREQGGTAEFRIALHPERLGQGIGKEIARRSLARGFSDPAIERIRLIVRKNNPRAGRLYEALKFQKTGECIEEIQGTPVEFSTMEIDRATFKRGTIP